MGNFFVIDANVQISELCFSGTQDGYDYVDLGLPSGRKWAIENFYVETSKNKGSDIILREWGGLWRMPQAYDFRELISECIWEIALYNNIGGTKLLDLMAITFFFRLSNGHLMKSL